MSTERNSYMEEVLQQQQAVSNELRKRKAPMPVAAAPAQAMRMARGEPEAQQAMMLPGVVEDGGRAVDVRITGWWRYKTVIVPPNAWVVHTRRGRSEPVHLGLGVSFPFNPYTDAYLVAPATMQTLAINARCICRERQGILVQAYVQWIIEDFKAAYQKIDFSDVDDPMRIVNIQLREQAEASIKDKVAAMSIDDVLADKKPIIEELTQRLREVAQGQGLKIVTVQIKEAVVSSTRLWQNLQMPFREEQQKNARIAELDRERAVQEREHIDSVAAFDREQVEERKREQLAAQNERARAQEQAETERTRKTEEARLAADIAKLEATRAQAKLDEIAARKKVEAAEAERVAAQLEAELTRGSRAHSVAKERERVDIELLALRRRTDNDISPARIEEQLVQILPSLVEKMPAPDKSEVVHISGDGNVPDGVAALAGLVKALRAVVTNGKSGAGGAAG